MSPPLPPDVDYLTRDYEGFRKLLITLIERAGSPWTERAAADLGITLVEALANRLDHLAYAGDRVAEESCLPTARRRESARRHAALGDHVLDRGNATRGFQRFELFASKPLTLQSGTLLGRNLVPGEPPSQRLVAETTETVKLDARCNEFKLARSAAAGDVRLLLLGSGTGPLDLRALGVRPGTRLCLVSDDQGDVVTVAQARGSSVILAEPLGGTWLAVGRNATRVFGNLAPMRHGRTRPWVVIGHGGVEPERASFADHLALLRRLRDEAEVARATWVRDGSFAAWWELANATIARVVCELRDRPEPDAKEAQRHVEQLGRAAALFRDLLRASGRDIPESLLATRHLPTRGQVIRVPSDEPPLWADEAATLEVKVGFTGAWTRWTERPDLLRSGPDDRHYVAEVDSDGGVQLRFGDGVQGALLPTDAQVIVRRVTGDPFAGDLGPGALVVLLEAPRTESDRNEPDADVLVEVRSDVLTTTNPLPTSGARPPEAVGDKLVQAVQRGLARRVVPVTREDYREVLLREVPALVEVGVSVSRRCVNVVVRPRRGEHPGRALSLARALVLERRLLGVGVRVRLAEPLFISIEIVLEVHPEVSAADTRARVREVLLELFGDRDQTRLGVARTRAEVYAAVEFVPGVVWSQVTAFNRASRSPVPRVIEEVITPEPHQVVRCLGLPDNDSGGRITTLVARRFRLQIEVSFADPDDRPDTDVLRAWLFDHLVGPDATPLRESWPEISAARIRDLLRRAARDVKYRLAVRALVIGDHTVDRIPLAEGDVPTLEHVQVEDRLYMPRYGVEIDLVHDGVSPLNVPAIRAHIERILSGPDSAPASKRWVQIDLARVNRALREDPDLRGLLPHIERDLFARELSVSEFVTLAGLPPGVSRLGTRSVVRVVPLHQGDVPILDALRVTVTTRRTS